MRKYYSGLKAESLDVRFDAEILAGSKTEEPITASATSTVKPFEDGFSSGQLDINF